MERIRSADTLTETPVDPSSPADPGIEVLLVGDGSSLDEAANRLEGGSWISVRTATSAAAGRELLSAGGIDCVVVGSDLPVATVTAFLRSIRKRRSDLPLILIGDDGDDAVGEALSAGVTDYVPRAVVDERPDVLTDRVERAAGAAVQRRSERHRQRLFAKAQDIADVGAWEYDVEAESLWWSEQVRRVHGLPPDEQPTIAESFDRYVPEDSETIEAAFERAIEEGIPYDVEVRLDDGGDESKWIRSRGEPEFEDDAVVRVRGSYQNVTDLKRRELQFESLHDASRELMAAKTRMDVAQITADASKNILEYVMTTVRLADEDDEVLRTFTATDQTVTEAGKRPGYRIDGETPAARCYRDGEPLIFDDLDRTADDYDRGALRSGIYVPIGDHGVLSTGDTEPYAFDEPDVEILGVLTKLAAGALTRIRSEQELQRQNDRLEEFASIVAHDLRNPLNVVRGELTLLEASAPTDQVDSIEASLDRMEALVEDVLSLARQGEVVGDTTAVGLAAVTRQAWANVATGAATLTVDCEGVDVLADEFRLQELFENLFKNAIEHGSTDGDLHTRRNAAGSGSEPSEAESDGAEGAPGDDADDVAITVGALSDGFFVEDDGQGVPDSEKEAVLEAGYTTATDGTGYGLYIVTEIAAAHGWEIEVADGRDGGARFDITDVETP